MATFFRNSDRSSSITGDALYAVQGKKSPTRKRRPGEYLYLAGGCEGAIDVEQDQFVDGSVGEGLGGHPE